MNTPDAASELLMAQDHKPASKESARVHPDWADRADGLSLWTRAKLAIVRGFLVGWVRVFRLEGLYAFGKAFAFCEYLVSINRRRRVLRRLEQVFREQLSDRQRRDAARRYFRRTRCDKMIYTIFDRLPREDMLKRVQFTGREQLDAALARGRGAYVAMSHYGSHHVAAMIMAQLGYRLAGVRDRHEGALRRYMQRKFAESFPSFSSYRMFFADAFPREIFRCYKENFVVTSALDVQVNRLQGARLRTCSAELFGEPCEFLTGPVHMAMRCGAPVMQGFVVARPNFHYELIVQGPLIDPNVDPEAPETIARAMQGYADGITEYLRRFPCHLSRI